MDRHAIDSQLAGALHCLVAAGRTGIPSVEMLSAIESALKNARDILRHPDPLTRRLDFLLLAIRESTTVSEEVDSEGKKQTVVKIHDRNLYIYAMTHLHKLDKLH